MHIWFPQPQPIVEPCTRFEKCQPPILSSGKANYFYFSDEVIKIFGG